jgi:hypothetical protein
MCFSRFLGDGKKLCTTLHIRMGICRVGTHKIVDAAERTAHWK